MNPKLAILKQLEAVCRQQRPSDIGPILWTDAQLIRATALRIERGDLDAWPQWIGDLRGAATLARAIRESLEELGWLNASSGSGPPAITLPANFFPPLTNAETEEFLAVLDPDSAAESEPLPQRGSGAIMYIEEKTGLTGHARIGRVRFSATRKTLYYAGRKLRSLKGSGYKANYFDMNSGMHYWISKCRKDGNDSLYPGIVEIDDDAREEYWTSIRNRPDQIHLSRFRSAGKHRK